MGVLAQDIKLLFPELVTTDSNGKQQVDMPGLTAVLIQSVKELQSSHQLELDTLKAENKAIKKNLVLQIFQAKLLTEIHRDRLQHQHCSKLLLVN